MTVLSLLLSLYISLNAFASDVLYLIKLKENPNGLFYCIATSFGSTE